MSHSYVDGIVECDVRYVAAIHSGLLYKDYNLHKPKTFGQVKMKEFAKEFAAVYHEK